MGDLEACWGYGNDVEYGYTPPSYKYEFFNIEDLVKSKIFQEQLKMALSHKQREIDSLRQELLKYIEEI